MLRSLLHYQSSTLLGLVGLAALALATRVYADNTPFQTSPRIAVMNVGTLSSEELLADAAYLNLASNPLDEAEMSQSLMHAQWLEAGLVESQEYVEGSDALEELAENAIKHYWDALVERDKSYDLYTPVVEGSFTTSSNGADFGVRLSGDTLKIRVKYAF